MKLLIIFGLISNLLTCVAAQADDTKSDPLSFQSCETEKVAFCRDQRGLAENAACLIKHDLNLSNKCKQDLERFIELRKQAANRGGGALGSFGGLNAFGPPIPILSYDGRYSPGNKLTSFTENRAAISAPIYKAEKDTVSLSLSGSYLHLGDSLTIDSGRSLPIDLYRMEVGGQYFRQLSNRKNWGLRTSVGYAGDKPFKNAKDITYSLNANYGFPGSENGYWVLSVFFANNSPLINYVPIPGFFYLYKTATFTGIFGIPILSLQWTPVYPWSFSLSFFGPIVQSEIAYGNIEKFQFFTGFYWTRQNYIPVSRDNDKDRLTIKEMKTALGFRMPLWSGVSAEIQGGRVFNRSLSVGSGFLNRNSSSAVVNADWVATWGLKARF